MNEQRKVHMTEKLVELDLIVDNPYQGRQSYENIETLARSIAKDGLQELPKARCKGKKYELKFGHRRREAFKWLKENWQAEGLPDRFNGYTVMPLDVEELTDEEMYRGAVIENEHRDDLNPIEKARMMLVYRDQFKKSSEEIGELFGMTGATVRGLIRLLDLPEPVQEKVESGEISQGAARKLLTIARVDENQVKQAVVNITTGMNADEAVDEAMRESDNAFIMWFGWRDGKPLAGDNLWALDTPREKFPMQYLPALKSADVAKALDMEFTADSRRELESWMNAFVEQPAQLGGGHWWTWHGSQKIEGDVAEFLIAQGAPEAQIVKLAHLIQPPACTACPFHSVSAKQHFCGFKPCHQRKRKAWVEAEMQRLSKKLKIAIYDPTKDGKTTLPLCESSYEDNYRAHDKLVKDRDADLRIQAHKNEYSLHKWTESHHCRLILVGGRATKVKEKKQEAARTEREKEEERQRQYQLERARRDAADKFISEQAVPQFAMVFKELTHIPAMCILAGTGTPKKNAKKADVLADLRRRLAARAMNNLNGLDWRLREQGPVAVAKFLQKVATTWGIKLPTDFMKIAQGFEPVSTETPKKEKKA